MIPGLKTMVHVTSWRLHREPVEELWDNHEVSYDFLSSASITQLFVHSSAM